MSDRQRRQRRTYETFLVETAEPINLRVFAETIAKKSAGERLSLTDEKYLRLLEMLADQLKIKDDKIIILQYQL